MSDEKPFDYGETRPDGQHERHPTVDTNGKKFVRPVRRSYKHLKCGGITTMGIKIAETYAVMPGYYGSTFCGRCGGYFPVGEDGEFVWVDNPGTGKDLDEKVGT